MKTTLGFFGAGKMAEGILAAAALQKDFDPQAVLMAEKVPARAKELAKRYGVRTTPDAKDVAKTARVIFLAVRPQDLAALAADVKPLLTKKTLVVSIAAGKSLATLKKALGRDVRLVRVMPNLALRAKEGMCAICPAANATKADVARVAKILNGAGRTVVLPERNFDAVTALSGAKAANYTLAKTRPWRKGDARSVCRRTPPASSRSRRCSARRHTCARAVRTSRRSSQASPRLAARRRQAWT